MKTALETLRIIWLLLLLLLLAPLALLLALFTPPPRWAALGQQLKHLVQKLL